MIAILIGGALLFAPLAAVPASANPDLVNAISLVDQKPPNPSVNTALIYTNTSADDVELKMRAVNHDGEEVGVHYMKVPANGLRFVFVSQFIDASDLPFVGWVEAKASRRVFANAVLLGVGTTDLPTQQRPQSRMVFPVTAAY